MFLLYRICFKNKQKTKNNILYNEHHHPGFILYNEAHASATPGTRAPSSSYRDPAPRSG